MSYLKYALILTTSTFMVGCIAAAPQLTASEQEIKSDLDSSQYQPAPREIRDNIDTQQILAQAAFWSHEYNLNPSDLEAAIKFSATLRKMGNASRAVEVTRTTRALYPRDPYLNAEHAAALIADQQTRPAMKIIDSKHPKATAAMALAMVAAFFLTPEANTFFANLTDPEVWAVLNERLWPEGSWFGIIADMAQVASADIAQ